STQVPSKNLLLVLLGFQTKPTYGSRQSRYSVRAILREVIHERGCNEYELGDRSASGSHRGNPDTDHASALELYRRHLSDHHWLAWPFRCGVALGRASRLERSYGRDWPTHQSYGDVEPLPALQRCTGAETISPMLGTAGFGTISDPLFPCDGYAGCD